MIFKIHFDAISLKGVAAIIMIIAISRLCDSRIGRHYMLLAPMFLLIGSIEGLKMLVLCRQG